MKKIPVNLRLRADLVAELKRQAKLSGETQTQLYEDCLLEHLKTKAAQRAAARKAAIEREQGKKP